MSASAAGSVIRSRRWNGATPITPGRLTGSTLSLTLCGDREDMMPSWPGEYRDDPVTAVAVPPASNSSRWSVPAQPQTAALTRSSMSVAITSANAAAAIHGC